MFLPRCCVAMVCLSAAWAFSASAAWAESAPAAAETDVAAWVARLDSDRFADRREASLKLSEMGARAMPALGEAALGASREVTVRALDILAKHYAQGDETTRQAARTQLERIAAADHAAAARHAQRLLSDADQPTPNNLPVFGGVAPVQIQARVQIQALGGPGVRQMQMQNVNGVRTVKVTEHDRRVEIVTDAGGAVKVSVTEKDKDGQEKTVVTEAKSADELRKNHPEAHQVYEKYSQGGGAIKIGGAGLNGLQLQLQPVPAPQGAPQAQRNVEAQRAEIQRQLDENRRRVEEHRRQILEQLQRAPGVNQPAAGGLDLFDSRRAAGREPSNVELPPVELRLNLQ